MDQAGAALPARALSTSVSWVLRYCRGETVARWYVPGYRCDSVPPCSSIVPALFWTLFSLVGEAVRVRVLASPPAECPRGSLAGIPVHAAVGVGVLRLRVAIRLSRVRYAAGSVHKPVTRAWIDGVVPTSVCAPSLALSYPICEPMRRGHACATMSILGKPCRERPPGPPHRATAPSTLTSRGTSSTVEYANY